MWRSLKKQRARGKSQDALRSGDQAKGAHWIYSRGISRLHSWAGVLHVPAFSGLRKQPAVVHTILSASVFLVVSTQQDCKESSRLVQSEPSRHERSAHEECNARVSFPAGSVPTGLNAKTSESGGNLSNLPGHDTKQNVSWGVHGDDDQENYSGPVNVADVAEVAGNQPVVPLMHPGRRGRWGTAAAAAWGGRFGSP